MRWSKAALRARAAAYRSGLERSIAQEIAAHGVKVHYEPGRLPYTVPATEHRYTPDFVLPNGIVVETKGLFEAKDRKKHLYVRESNPGLDLRFVFQRSASRLYKGSPSTYADWCAKHGFLYADKHIPVCWLTEDTQPVRFAAVMKLLE